MCRRRWASRGQSPGGAASSTRSSSSKPCLNLNAGGVDTDAMETEDTEPATSSQAPAVAAPIRLFVTSDGETKEQERAESKRQRTVAGFPVCSLLPAVDEIPLSYVATHQVDERPVYDRKTGERLALHLVKVARRTECEEIVRHQLFECADRVGSRQESQMSMAGRDERGSRWTTRAQQARCGGSGPRNPI